MRRTEKRKNHGWRCIVRFTSNIQAKVNKVKRAKHHLACVGCQCKRLRWALLSEMRINSASMQNFTENWQRRWFLLRKDIYRTNNRLYHRERVYSDDSNQLSSPVAGLTSLFWLLIHSSCSSGWKYRSQSWQFSRDEVVILTASLCSLIFYQHWQISLFRLKTRLTSNLNKSTLHLNLRYPGDVIKSCSRRISI